MSKTAIKEYTASDAKNKFAQLIDEAQRAPIAIVRHGRKVAFVISPADIEIMEDYYLGTQSKVAIHKGVSMNTEESMEFLNDILS